jgi:hypothetical protein
VFAKESRRVCLPDTSCEIHVKFDVQSTNIMLIKQQPMISEGAVEPPKTPPASGLT